MSVWQARDRLVLEYIMANPPYHGMLYVDTQSDAARPDLPAVTEWELHLSIETLSDAGYLSWTNTGAEGGGTRHYQDILVTGAGKQALGLWPRFDALGSPAELADLLEALPPMRRPTRSGRTYETRLRRCAGHLLLLSVRLWSARWAHLPDHSSASK